MAVGIFQHRNIQTFLGLEVVVNHALARAHGLGDVVDARARQALLSELAGRDRQDVCHGARRVVGTRCFFGRRLRSFFDSGPGRRCFRSSHATGRNVHGFGVLATA